MTRPSCVAILGFTTLCGSAFAQSSFVELGGGITPSGVSEDGSIVAGTDASQYFLWTASNGVVLLGGTAPSINGAGGQAKISNDGRIICGTRQDPISGLYEIATYDLWTGVWTSLGGIGGSSGASMSSGWNVSGDGRCTVGLGWVNAGTAHAVRSLPGSGLVDMGSSVANRSTRANGVNSSGSVIVGWQDALSGFRQGAIWVDGVQSIITTGGGAPVSEAQDVSEVGTWVVGNGSSSTGGQAWRWSAATGLQQLGTLNPGWTGFATAISDDGKTIIGFERAFGVPALFGVGFIWRQGIGMTDLKTYLLSQGVPVPATWIVALPLGISANGRTIVGMGRDNGLADSFVAQVDDCTGSSSGYGSALAGTGDYAPSLAIHGCPAIGSPFSLDITSVRGGAAGMLFIGTGQTSVPLLGGQFLIGSLALSLPIAVGGVPGKPAAGTLSVSTTLVDPALVGLTLTLQAAFADPGAIFGASLTQGATMTIS